MHTTYKYFRDIDVSFRVLEPVSQLDAIVASGFGDVSLDVSHPVIVQQSPGQVAVERRLGVPTARGVERYQPLVQSLGGNKYIRTKVRTDTDIHIL